MRELYLFGFIYLFLQLQLKICLAEFKFRDFTKIHNNFYEK